MKLNWGTGIVIAFLCFISFIMYFVINMSTNKSYEHDLVTEDYYKQELEFQNEINHEKNAKALTKNLSWQKTTSGIVINFPDNLNANAISGDVFLYRPSNKKFDFSLPITLNAHKLTIPKDKLLEGRWDIKVKWKHNNTSYLFKDKIVY